eukprot:COSAG02_NODE_5919_length_3940_cov_3.229107_2_plen_45_part_00
MLPIEGVHVHRVRVQGRNKTAVAPCPDMADLWRQKVRILFTEDS